MRKKTPLGWWFRGYSLLLHATTVMCGILAVRTFQGGHPVRELHLFAGGVHRSPQLIQDQWGRLIHLLDLHFPTVTHAEQSAFTLPF